jgi:hypothetical protein
MWNHSSRPDVIGGSDARIIMADDEVEPTDLLFGVATKDTSRRWCEAITGRMPIGWHVVAISYATAVIFLGWWPWNLLLLLLLFSSSKHSRYGGFDKVRAGDLVGN